MSKLDSSIMHLNERPMLFLLIIPLLETSIRNRHHELDLIIVPLAIELYLTAQ